MENKINWSDQEVLITGGTGSLGKALTNLLLTEYFPKGLRILSRGEMKQYQMKQELESTGLLHKVAFLIGDVRDEYRMELAMHGVDIVIHAAAIKHIPVAEENPLEVIYTNITGSQNVLRAALKNNVKRAMLVSTDKAVHPVNLYGATKMCAERLFIQGNVYSGFYGPKFSVCRYGNVVNSRGSVIPLFKEKSNTGSNIPITDKLMSRFWIKLEEAAQFIINRIEEMKGGEIFVPLLPSCTIWNLARAAAPNASIETIGVRPGEKLSEMLVSAEESRNIEMHFHENEKYRYYTILPQTERTLLSHTKAFILDSLTAAELTNEEIKELMEKGRI